MFTRDISLEDAILDLIDNSIDSLIRTKKIDLSVKLLKKIASNSNVQSHNNDLPCVDVQISDAEFKLSDTCGGISRDLALKEVFRFGRVQSSPMPSLGVYGIGLKRAIFKIGNDIKIQSKTKDTGFVAKLHTQDWVQDDEHWEIPIETTSGVGSLKKAGTTITIHDLSPDVKMRINDGTLGSRLETFIATTYPLFLGRYVVIKLNGNIVKPRQIPIGESDKVTPANKKFESDGVQITLMAGLAERVDNKWNIERAGWYVICNGRVVVSADKTDLTGWGLTLPQFVSKYRGFLGIVFFFSDNPENLPWTTTKRGLNRESRVYQYTRNQMLLAARPVINFLNNMYPSDDLEEPVEREIANDVTATNIGKLAAKPQTNFKVKSVQKTVASSTVTVQYKTNKQDIEKVKSHLNKPTWSAGQVGKYTFDYFLDKECPE